MISLLTGIVPGPDLVSKPAGGGSPSGTRAIPLSKASRLVLPARVSLDPPGLRKFSNFAIAPDCRDRSLHCKTCVVDFQPGPRICLATSFQAAVFPTPGGPVMSKCGGSVLTATDRNDLPVPSGTDSSSKLLGAYSVSQLDTRVRWRGGP